MSAPTFDLLVIGAGPAGASAALAALAAEPAARVALVDRAVFPRDKACGDGLTPSAVAALRGLGVEHVLDGFAPVRRLTATGPGGRRLVADLADPAFVVPRRVLDDRLVSAAVERGAEFIHARITSLAAADDRMVVDGRWSARCVVAADGANSTVRRSLGLARQPEAHTGVGLRGYATVPSGTGRLDVCFAPGPLWPAYGWLFTGGDGQANVGAGTFDATTGPNRRELEALLRRLFPDARVEPDSVSGHRLPLSSARPAPAAGRVLLAGDAASLVDPLTGEGIHTALLSGMLAGRAAVARPDSPSEAYRRALRRHLGARLRQTRLGAHAMRRPGLLDALIAAAIGDPAVARAVAGLASGEDTARAWLTVGAGMIHQRLEAPIQRLGPSRGA